jgi:hypothetical protein
MSRRGSVHRWGPRGGGGWAGGRPEATLNSEAHGGCHYVALKAHRGGAA